MRDSLNPLVLSELIAAHKARLSEIGVSVRYSWSFETLEEVLPIEEKARLSEHFRTELNTYTEATAFWVGGFSEGQLVALCAARLDDLGSESLDGHLRRYWRRCYPGADAERAQPAERQPRFWSEIKGRVAYYGDFHVKRDRFQGRGIPKLFAPLCVLLGLWKWDPDWHYCWVNQSDWSKRYPLAYGFSRINPLGLVWEVPPATIASDLVAASNSRADALDWMDGLERAFLAASNN